MTRDEIYDLFNLTADERALAEELRAARERADAQRAEFVERLRETAARISEEMTAELLAGTDYHFEFDVRPVTDG